MDGWLECTADPETDFPRVADSKDFDDLTAMIDLVSIEAIQQTIEQAAEISDEN